MHSNNRLSAVLPNIIYTFCFYVAQATHSILPEVLSDGLFGELGQSVGFLLRGRLGVDPHHIFGPGRSHKASTVRDTLHGHLEVCLQGCGAGHSGLIVTATHEALVRYRDLDLLAGQVRVELVPALKIHFQHLVEKDWGQG